MHRSNKSVIRERWWELERLINYIWELDLYCMTKYTKYE
jgi:hypothetical protein